MFSFLLLALPSIHLNLGKVSKTLPQLTAQLQRPGKNQRAGILMGTGTW